jgi:hypothetical protein
VREQNRLQIDLRRPDLACARIAGVCARKQPKDEALTVHVAIERGDR